MAFLKPMGDAAIEQLALRGGERVLDIATGTGEPGMTIAEKFPNVHVIATDLSEGMLELAKEKAESRGLKNFETRVADACNLPFADASFDAISCRMGFMFFPETARAVQEFKRVLKPGGPIAVSAWSSAEKNPWITTAIAPAISIMQLPPPQPDSPSMFRFGHPGSLAEFFRKAGFQNTKEIEIRGKLSFGTIERFWEKMTEIAAPLMTAMQNADAPTREKIKSEVFALGRERAGNTEDFALDYSAWLVSAQKA